MTTFLPPNTVHAFYGSSGDTDMQAAESLLFEAEIARAEQFKHKNDQHNFVATRAQLKKQLGFYLQIPPLEIKFRYGVNGKPFLKQESDIQFSVSHSGNFFLMGFTRSGLLGVDIEFLNRSLDIEKLKPFLLTPAEQLKFAQTNQAEHQEQFICAWTRKEALLKAKGTGLTLSPTQLEVSFLKTEKPAVLSTFWSAQESCEWFLDCFDIGSHYRGAVAVHGQVESLVIEKADNL